MLNRRIVSYTLAAGLITGATILAQSATSGQTAAPPPQTAPQPQAPARPQRGAARGGWQGEMDEARARQLYVSNDHADHGRGVDFERQVQQKAEEDKRWTKVTAGVVDFQKVTYRSSVGDLDVPAYVFQPLKKRGNAGHAALVFVHGGVHSNWAITYWPFVREAVERGYVVVAPDYRGSTGYGEKHYMEIDYGGYEIEDVMSATDYLKTLPHVDPNRVGIMGWSHGGYISLFSVFRDTTPFKAAVAMVPVTNLIHRLSFSGPELSAQLRDPEADRRIAIREARGVHQALAAVSRRQAEDAACSFTSPRTTGRLLLRGPADHRRASIAQAGPFGDQGLRRPAGRSGKRRSHLQSPGEPRHARAGRQS